MPYSADISRNNPACILFLIDQSGSMTEALSGQPGFRKMDQAAEALNGILNSISLRCSQGMEIRDYFEIGVIAYTTDSRGNPTLQSTFNDTSLDNPFLLISEVVDSADIEERMVKEPDGAGGLLEVARRVPVWLRPAAAAGTPMCEALSVASRSLHTWINQHPDSYPPIIINITDGVSTDGDPEPLAQEIMQLQTNDGSVLVFNCHLSSVNAMPIQFPDNAELLPDEYARKLFRMSSVFPESVRSQAATIDLRLGENSRGFVFNANMESLVQFLDIGTRGPSNLH